MNIKLEIPPEILAEINLYETMVRKKAVEACAKAIEQEMRSNANQVPQEVDNWLMRHAPERVIGNMKKEGDKTVRGKTYPFWSQDGFRGSMYVRPSPRYKDTLLVDTGSRHSHWVEYGRHSHTIKMPVGKYKNKYDGYMRFANVKGVTPYTKWKNGRIAVMVLKNDSNFVLAGEVTVRELRPHGYVRKTIDNAPQIMSRALNNFDPNAAI